MRLSKPKLYDEDNNEIIPPEGATGFVVGEHGKFAWTTSEDYKTTFIYTPIDKLESENINETFKLINVPRIFNDTWYVIRPVPYPAHTPRINGKLFFKYRQKYRNKTNKKMG